jgi:hypothetical protein
MSRYARAAEAAWNARRWFTALTLADLGLAALLHHHPKAWLILAVIAAGLWLIRSWLGQVYTSSTLLAEDELAMKQVGMNPTKAQLRHIRRTRP